MSIKVMSWLWEHSPAEGSELLLLLALADFADDTGANAYPSVARLARKCRIDRSTVQRITRRLVESGQLAVEAAVGRGNTNRYRLLMIRPEKAADRGPLPPEKAADRGHSEPEIAADRGHSDEEKAAFEAEKGRAAMRHEPSGTVIEGGVYVTRAGAGAREETSDPPPSNPVEDQEPPSRCAAHADVPEPPPCHACKTAREAREAWQVERVKAARRAEKIRRREEREQKILDIVRCGICDEAGYVDGRVCNHDPEQFERMARGVRAAREALANPNREAEAG